MQYLVLECLQIKSNFKRPKFSAFGDCLLFVCKNQRTTSVILQRTTKQNLAVSNKM